MAITFRDGKAYELSQERATVCGQEQYCLVARKEVEFSLDLLYATVNGMTNTTFGQFWRWVTSNDANTKVLGQIFASLMGRVDIMRLVEEGKQPEFPVDTTDRPGNIQYLEVYWTDDTMPRDIMATVYPNPDGTQVTEVSASSAHELRLSPQFHGWGQWDGHATGTCGGYGVEYTAVNCLMGYTLKLNDEVKLSEKTEREYAKKFVLKDILEAVLFELTWNGGARELSGAHDPILG